MGEFFQLIMDNIFIIILVLSGIIGFFSSNKEEKKKQEQRTEQQRPQQAEPRPTPTPSGPREPKRQEVYRTELKPSKTNVITTASASFENEQKSQMEKMQSRYGASSSSTIDEDIAHQGLKFREALKPLEDLSEEKDILKKDIKHSLRNKGLINGIIMAEVLGKPRSLKRYESVSLERYKR